LFARRKNKLKRGFQILFGEHLFLISANFITMELPLTPRKQIMELQSQGLPSSPDMKQARNRLGHLLSGIRKGDGQSALVYREEQ
jgi:hypothetical protein